MTSIRNSGPQKTLLPNNQPVLTPWTLSPGVDIWYLCASTKDGLESFPSSTCIMDYTPLIMQHLIPKQDTKYPAMAVVLGRLESCAIGPDSTSCGNCIRRGYSCTFRQIASLSSRSTYIGPKMRALRSPVKSSLKSGGDRTTCSNVKSGILHGNELEIPMNVSVAKSPCTESLVEHFQTAPRRSHDSNSAQHLKSGGRLAAYLAWDHVTAKGAEFLHILCRYGWDGSCLIQVGFNAELLRLGQGILQEIYIFLESELDPAVSKQVATIFNPFPVTIYTPRESRHVPQLPENESIWDLWMLRGIYRENIQSQVEAPMDGNEARKTASNSGLPHQNGNDNSRRSGGGDKRAGKKSPNGAGGNDGGHGGKKANNVSIFKRNTKQPSTREVSIPFSSTLTCTGDSPNSLIWFKTNACVEIRIEENHRSHSRPAGMYWGGPWFEARMALLDAEVQTVPAGKPEYNLNFSQIRFIASESPSSILTFTPSIIRAEEDNVRSKVERNTSGGIRGVISASPSLRIEGTHAHTTGEERTQNRWGVVGHCLPSDINGVTGTPQTTMVWKYTHNSAFYAREARNMFEPRPAATFGLSRTSEVEPCLEVEVVTCYSWSTPSQTFRDWFTGRSKPKNKPPAFLNFLHQTSVVIDLERVKESTEWVVGLTANEQHTVARLGNPGKTTIRQLESDDGGSDCHVSLQAALRN